MGSDLDLILGITSIVASFYCFYTSIGMKKTGKINKSLLLDKQTDVSKCKNTAEYIKKATPLINLLGVTLLIYGTVSIAEIYYSELYWVMVAAIVICFGVVVLYGMLTSKLKKQYF